MTRETREKIKKIKVRDKKKEIIIYIYKRDRGIRGIRGEEGKLKRM